MFYTDTFWVGSDSKSIPYTSVLSWGWCFSLSFKIRGNASIANCEEGTWKMSPKKWISGNCSCSQVNWEFLLWGLGFKKFTGNFTTYLRGEICTENFVLWYMYPHQNWQHSDKFLSLVLPSYWTGIWFQSVSWLSRCLIRLILSWVECAHIGFSLVLMFSGQLSRGDSWSEDFSISFRRSCHSSSFFKRIFCKKEKEKLKVGEKIFLFLLFPSVQ